MGRYPCTYIVEGEVDGPHDEAQTSDEESICGLLECGEIHHGPGLSRRHSGPHEHQDNAEHA